MWSAFSCLKVATRRTAVCEHVRVGDALGRRVRRVGVNLRGRVRVSNADDRGQKLVAARAVVRARGLAALLPVTAEAGVVPARRGLEHPALEPEGFEPERVGLQLARRLRDVL